MREFRYGRGLFAVETGPADGRVVILLHGGLATGLSCLRFGAALADRFRVVAPDLRGSGRSHDAGPLSWDQLADDVAALVRALGVARAVIGGTSFGAGCAVRAALRHPDIVDALLLLSPAFAGADIGLNATQVAAMRAMDDVGRRAPSEGIAVMYPLLDTLPEAVRERARAIVATFDPASIAATTAFMVSNAQPFARGDELAAIAAPTLLVPGIDDTHPRTVSDVYAARLPNCTVREVTEAGYATAIRDFLG